MWWCRVQGIIHAILEPYSLFLNPPLIVLHLTFDSTLIVLYAIPPDASNHKTSSQLANDVFGINTNEAQDTSNVRTQMAACSRGQLTYIPACGTVEQACFGKTPIVNGVLEVPITQSVTGVASGDVVNYVTAQAQIILNGTGVAYGSFTQVCSHAARQKTFSHLPFL